MLLIGDVHGKFKECKKIVTENPGKTIIQVGDFGVGFPGQSTLPTFPENFYFIRGNHDNPAVARAHPNYLGDYGVKIIDDRKVFYLSGAWSIDQRFRRSGLTWWYDEELSIKELEDAFELYINERPEIVLSHDCPTKVAAHILLRHSLYGNPEVYPTRTGQALSAMFSAYQPKYWNFGHYHADWEKTIEGTEFQCLNELSISEL
jgi:hypothetical protein